MSWWGKLAGGAFGYMLGGPLGALIGAALGHHFDRGLDSIRRGPPIDFSLGAQERVQTAFFTTTFLVMGHLAKVDGRVSENEIRLARAVMVQMGLSGELQQVAIRLFNEGKQPDFPLHEVLTQFRRECRGRQNLLRMFIEIQLQAAYADGALHQREHSLLREVCEFLGFPLVEFEHLVTMARAAYTGEQQRAAPARGPRLSDAYALLGVDASASDAEVKRAYRRLMSQHHPDKLVAKGLPEEMMKVATEKTQTIKAAYEQVMAARAS